MVHSVPTRIVGVIFAFALWSGLGAFPAQACRLCIGFPKQTAVDVLLESHTVVLARENPDKPFSLAPVEFLKGEREDVEIDLFLDSNTRRLLARNPNLCVVVVRLGDSNSWRRLTLADTAYQEVIRRILIFAPEWQNGEGRRERAKFFCTLFGHEDRDIFELAYVELARAPYDVIRQLGQSVERSQVERLLNDRQYLEWKSLSILLLAQQATEKDRERIAASLRNADRFGLSLNLGAWAAAAIELEGEQAIAFIEERFFRNPDRDVEELNQVFQALSIHGSEGRVELRDRVVASYQALLDVHPEMSARVARDLLAWERTEYAADLAQSLRRDTPLEPMSKRVVQQYLSRVAELQTRGAADD